MRISWLSLLLNTVAYYFILDLEFTKQSIADDRIDILLHDTYVINQTDEYIIVVTTLLALLLGVYSYERFMDKLGKISSILACLALLWFSMY
jgi:hypothetical protein